MKQIKENKKTSIHYMFPCINCKSKRIKFSKNPTTKGYKIKYVSVCQDCGCIYTTIQLKK